MLPEQVSYIANGTSMESEYHFHSDSVMVPPLHVVVTAISKCSLSGPFAIEPIPEFNDKAMLTSVHDVVSKTENEPRPQEYRHMMNGNK